MSKKNVPVLQTEKKGCHLAIKYKPLATKSLAKQIADNIEAAIFNGDVKVDERLPTESEFASQFGVSRPTIREALKLLAAKNLIRSRRGPTGGTFVKKPSQNELSSIITSTTTMLVSMGEFESSSIEEARLRAMKSINFSYGRTVSHAIRVNYSFSDVVNHALSFPTQTETILQNIEQFRAALERALAPFKSPDGTFPGSEHSWGNIFHSHRE